METKCARMVSRFLLAANTQAYKTKIVHTEIYILPIFALIHLYLPWS